MTWRVREAREADLLGVLNVLDGAALSTDRERIAARIGARDVFVAVPQGERERVLGVCVREGERITAVAVRRRRRGQGIGSALVAAAARDRTRLVTACDADAVPFYEALGFDVRGLADGRFVGRLDPANGDAN